MPPAMTSAWSHRNFIAPLRNQQHANCNTSQLLPRSDVLRFFARVAKRRSRGVLPLHSARCAVEHDNLEDAGSTALHTFESAFESDVVLFESWCKCCRRGGAYGDRLFLRDADAREMQPHYPGKCGWHGRELTTISLAVGPTAVKMQTVYN